MKHTTRLTACLLALALTACTAAPQDMPAGTTTETAAAPAQTAEPTTETPAVQDTLTPIYTTWGAAVGQDAVYSAMNIDDAGQYFATTIDFSTGEQRILCKKLGCSHTDESCPAYMTAIRNGCVPKAMLLPVGDRLYWLVDGRYNESDGAYLDVSNLDGSDRHRVAEGDALPDLTNAYVWYTDGTALYTFVRSYDEYSAFRLDEGGAACFFTRSIPDGEDYFALGCWQDKIVLQHSAGYQQQPLNPAGEAATDEELRAWLAADEQARNEQTKNICLLDTAGSMTDTDMTWSGDAGNVQLRIFTRLDEPQYKISPYKELFTDKEIERLETDGHLGSTKKMKDFTSGRECECYVSVHEATNRLTTLPVDALTLPTR